ncbi:hypothetical protein [Nocardia xishanensis]
MGLMSARFSGDPVLEKCLAGPHRMMEPEENLSVMRVQEALRRVSWPDRSPSTAWNPSSGSSSHPCSRRRSPADVTTSASRCSTASIPSTVALWLRQAVGLTFTSKPEQQEISAQVFRDTADAIAADPNAAPSPGKGLFPGPDDFH